MPQWTFRALAQANMATLEWVFNQGEAPPLEDVVGFEYRGWNILPPYGVPLFWAMSNIRFIKVFYRRSDDPDPAQASHVRGYNLKVRRGGLDDPWMCAPSDAQPLQLGYYNLHTPESAPRVSAYPHALFLDYDLDANNLFTGRTLEDYMVCPNPGDHKLLLGKAYLNLGPLRFGSFFVAERLQEHRIPPD